MYTENTIFSELLENQAVRELMDKVAPGMADGPAMEYMKGMSVGDLLANMPEKKRGMFQMLLDAANGKKVSIEAVDPKKQLPEIEADEVFSYDIDDVDGSMYMLDHLFSGCLVVRFSKQMENVYGKVSYHGKELPKGVIKPIATAGGIQMCGIPVRDILKEYDKEYRLVVEAFCDTDGNVMEPQEITIRTLPEKQPDAAYAEHDNVAFQAAAEGMVLLKNEKNFLPLEKNQELQLCGEEMFRIGAVGAGRINPRYSIGIRRGIREYSSFSISDTAKTVLWTISRPSGENYDNNAVKGEFYLSEEEELLFHKLCREEKDIVVLINSGYPMDLRWTKYDAVKAVLWCGFPGMLGGKAVVEILDGRVNPSGKLPDTWSLDYWDIPSSANFYQPPTVQEALGAGSKVYVDTFYEEDIYVGYRYFETFGKEVMYPFGFGLSYTSFAIQAKLQGREVQATVQNTGKVSGKEVVQIYVQIPDGKLEQPVKRLVGFQKTNLLAPMEQQTLTIPINREMLASYEEETACWILEPGRYLFYAGNDVKTSVLCGCMEQEQQEILKQVKNRMQLPVKMSVLSRKGDFFPKGQLSGVKEDVSELKPKAVRSHFPEEQILKEDMAASLSIEELARLSVCASAGWGMHEKGEAGRLYELENQDIPSFIVADGNNGVNIRKTNIGMPCSNTVCATWNTDLVWDVGRVIAEEAKENNIQMILGPGMNIHRNPLNGRHPEYFSEDPYLAGTMAGYQSKGLEENGVGSCMKHFVGNNSEASRKRQQSMITERALREIYLKAFEVAFMVHQPDSVMTGYNAVNGCYTAEDEELLQGILREEFGFHGFVMTDWESYETVDVAAAVQAGNCWITPGSKDNTYVDPIIEGTKSGMIQEERLRENVRRILKVAERRK